MLTIRLVNFGKKNAPAFRIMANSEVLGFFNPQNTPPKLQLDKERVDWWVNHGAQISTAVSKLLAGKYEFKPYSGSVVKESKEQALPAAAGTPAETPEQSAEPEQPVDNQETKTNEGTTGVSS